MAEVCILDHAAFDYNVVKAPIYTKYVSGMDTFHEVRVLYGYH